MLQTAWFVMSILSELVFIISARTKKFFIFACRPSYPLLILLIITGSVTLMLPFNQLTQELFSFTHISAQHMAFISGLVVSYFIATETVKLLYVFWSTRKSKKRS
jgi:magnesium-transporting ATPase (P-type)